MEALVYKDKKMLRRGYTTGTCAALAAQGAVSFLVSGIWPETAELMTPAGQMVRVPLMEKKAGNGAASCAVKKEYSKKQRTEDLQYLLNIMRILKLMIFILKKKTEIRCAMLTVI